MSFIFTDEIRLPLSGTAATALIINSINRFAYLLGSIAEMVFYPYSRIKMDSLSINSHHS
jgi:hypothetical protein